MRRAPDIVLLLSACSFLAACAHSHLEGSWGSSSTSAQVRATGGAALVLGVAAALADPYQPDTVPPLDPQRKVNEQDCSRPIDLSAGNLRCR